LKFIGPAKTGPAGPLPTAMYTRPHQLLLLLLLLLAFVTPIHFTAPLQVTLAAPRSDKNLWLCKQNFFTSWMPSLLRHVADRTSGALFTKGRKQWSVIQ